MAGGKLPEVSTRTILRLNSKKVRTVADVQRELAVKLRMKRIDVFEHGDEVLIQLDSINRPRPPGPGPGTKSAK